MLSNYLKVGLRNLKRYRLNGAINTTGLAIGLASLFLVLLYVTDELEYDRHFRDSGRIYRVILDGVVAGNAITIPGTPAPLAETLHEEYPEVEAAVRMRGTTRGADPVTVEVEERLYREHRLIYADSSFFRFWGVELLEGEAGSALSQPNSVVLTPATAEKYFGEESPLGRTIHISGLDQDFRVTGIADPLPPQTHFHFDLLASLVTDRRSRSDRWLGGIFMTYVKLNEPNRPEQVDRKFPRLVQEKVVPQMEEFMGIPFEEFLNQGGTYRYYLQPLEEIHLDSHLDTEWEANGNRTYLQIFSLAGLLIVVIAGINFTNLATSQATRREDEIDLRKALGAYRKQITLQLLSESALISLIASAAGLLLIRICLPAFNRLTGKEFAMTELLDPVMLLLYGGLALLFGLAAGLYPALRLSALGSRGSGSVAGRGKVGRQSGWTLRNLLVCGQFTVSAILIIGTLVIDDHLEYMRSKELGFETDGIVVVDKAGDLGNRREAFRNELLGKPGVAAAAFSSTLPGREFGRAAYQPDDSDETLVLPVLSIDHAFPDLYGIPLSEGRMFSEERSGEQRGILLNRQAARNAGWERATGKTFNSRMSGARPLEVFGVVNDFHFQSLRNRIQPLILEYAGPEEPLTFLSIKLETQAVDAGLRSVEEVWNTFLPGSTFEYEFFDREIASLYRNDEQLARLIRLFALLAIWIAGMGLLGMMVQMTDERKREIGIRKALGSSRTGIMLLLLRRMTLPVGIGSALAVPLCYLLANDWLQHFAYRVPLTIEPFMTGILLTLVTAAASTAHVVLRASSLNPVTVLRNP